ncbi:MAG: cyanophycinase [Bacteroidetes bacterium]|nr:cyanophycinase [Bacteroidota bacterium]
MTDRTKRGKLIPIGGNEDKGAGTDENYTLDFVQQGILSHVVRESGGVDAKILVVPTASSIPEEVGENYQEAFAILGCSDVRVIHIRKKGESDQPEFLHLLQEADCVMFTGGDQSRISRRIGGSEFFRIMLDRHLNDELNIAGTSAGAMAMALEMIAGGSSTEAFFKGAVQMKKGLGLLPKLIIDTHFIQRGRFGRLTEAVARHPHCLGFGLAEDTGLIIKEGRYAKVIGSGMVIVIDPSGITHNNDKILKDGTPMTLIGLNTHILSNGDTIDLETRAAKALPMHDKFEWA